MVFPIPVCVAAITSLPCKIVRIAFTWIAVGELCNFFLLKYCILKDLNLNLNIYINLAILNWHLFYKDDLLNNIIQSSNLVTAR